MRQTAVFCTYCRSENPEDGQWCVSCGKDLRAQRTPAPGGGLRDSIDGRETVRPPSAGGDAALSEGHLIAGRWRVEGFLGRGGMGEVYRVFDETTRRERALKRIHPGLTRSESARQRFLEEAALSQELVHRHVVRTFDVASESDRLLFTMELVEGGSLREEIERLAAAGERMPVARALEIADQILAALEYAHRFTIHRDVKPENVLLTSKGQVKLADFGIAKMVDPGRLASMTQALGTPYYMAPEQLRAQGAVDARADLYGVGAVLYELLTGELPAGRFKLPSELRSGLPAGLDALVEKALAPDPEQRFADASTMRSGLREVGEEAERRRREAEVARKRAAAERQKREAEERARVEARRRAAAAQPEPPAPLPALPAPPPASTNPADKPRHPGQALLIVSLGLVLWAVAMGVVYFSVDGRSRSSASIPSPTPLWPPAAVDTAPSPAPASPSPEEARQARIASLLVEAREQFESLNVTVPEGANALETYREVLRLDPGNADANAALREIRDLFLERARVREVAEQWDGANDELEKALAVVPDDTGVKARLALVEARLLDPPDMVPVPAGSFRMGSKDGSGDDRPVHEVSLDAYWIDRTEVTVGAYRKCVDVGRCSAPRSGGSCNWGKSDRGDHPVNCVDWNQAKTYCSWTGKRLPTEAEWEKAARGTDGRTYPWGNAKASCDYAVMDDGGSGCGRGSTWPVGSKPRGASPYGAEDMAGNVWEWVADRYGGSYYSSSPSRNPQGPSSGASRVLRGGSFYPNPSGLRAFGRSGGDPGSRYYYGGFRCARDR